jgi:hypothetical protein
MLPLPSSPYGIVYQFCYYSLMFKYVIRESSGVGDDQYEVSIHYSLWSQILVFVSEFANSVYINL